MITNTRYIEFIAVDNKSFSIVNSSPCYYLLSIYSVDNNTTIQFKANIDGNEILSSNDPSNFRVNGEKVKDFGYVAIGGRVNHIRYMLDNLPESFSLYVKSISDDEFEELDTIVANQCEDNTNTIVAHRDLFDPFGLNSCCDAIRNKSIALSKGFDISEYTPYKLLNGELVSVDWDSIIYDLNDAMPRGYTLVIVKNGISVFDAIGAVTRPGILPSRIS